MCPYHRVVHGTMGCYQKSFKLVWGCHQLLSGFLANSHMPRVSRQSRLLLIIRVIFRAYRRLHRYPGIYLMVHENSGKPRLRNRLMKVVRPVFATNGIPYLQMRSVESHSTSDRKKAEKEEGMKFYVPSLLSTLEWLLSMDPWTAAKKALS
jgi:hypothetical protein